MVTCSSLDVVQIWNPATYTDLALDFEVAGEDPRGLATSPSSDKVYAAVFESGNHSTIIRDGSPPSEDTDWITWAIGRADAGQFGIVAHGVESSEQRSWAYASGTGGSAVFESDRRGETTTHNG